MTDVWLLLIVMSLATYRLTRLVVEDDFPPVLWMRRKIAGGWVPVKESDSAAPRPPTPVSVPSLSVPPRLIDGVLHRYVRRSKWSPQWLADLVSCSWCAGGWVAAAVVAGTDAAVGLPAPVLVWPAVWALGSLLASQDWA